jgi:hypothetical protein
MSLTQWSQKRLARGVKICGGQVTNYTFTSSLFAQCSMTFPENSAPLD